MKLGQRVYYPQLNIHGITKTAVTPNGKIRILCDDNVLRWAMASDLKERFHQTVQQRQQEEIAILQQKLAEAKRKLERKAVKETTPGRHLSHYVMPHPHEPDEDEREEIQARRAAILAEKIAAGEVSAETVAGRAGAYE